MDQGFPEHCTLQLDDALWIQGYPPVEGEREEEREGWREGGREGGREEGGREGGMMYMSSLHASTGRGITRILRAMRQSGPIPVDKGGEPTTNYKLA